MAKKQSGEATETELTELRELIAGETASGYTSEIIEKIWKAPMARIPERELPPSSWEKIRAATSAGRLSTLILRRLAVAASVLVVIGFGGWLALRSGTGNDDPASSTTQKNQVSTRTGSKSKLELPDGTQVWLNGDSKLTYAGESFGKEHREVMLTGEAFFDVVKNENVPFIIRTGRVNITVKGTAFNVKAYPSQRTVETALVRGLVEISTEEDPDRKILLKPNEKITIPVSQSDETAIAKASGDSSRASLYTITRIQPDTQSSPAEMAWLNAQLVFDDEPFATLAPKMESWFNITIRFADENIKRRRFSGTIEKETLEETLEAMKLSYRFRYQIRDNELLVSNN